MKKAIILLFLLSTLINLKLAAQYCMSGGPSQDIDSNLEELTLIGVSSGINHFGCPGIVGIEDYTASQFVNLAAGSSYTISVKFGTCGGNYPGLGEAWIDFNGNAIFEPSESILQWQGTPPGVLTNYNFTVPLSAISGSTRMRVIQHEGAFNFPLDPCASFTWGSVSDFTVNITGGANCFTISNYPYVEDFENSFMSWSQDATDSIDWSMNAGTTPSINTGPSSAFEGSNYLYIESSSPNYPAKVANLISPCFDLSSLNDPLLSFYYHMYGADMGTLNLQYSINGSNWTTIWSRTGDQGDEWFKQVIDLSSFQSANEFRLRFNGITGNSFYSDICLDLININCAGSVGDYKLDAIPVLTYPYSDTNNTMNCYNNYSLVYPSSDVFYLALLDPTKDSLEVSLCGSSFDTYLTIQNTNGEVIYYNDDHPDCTPSSKILFPTEGLDSVYIIVEGWNNENGSYILNINNNYSNPNVAIGTLEKQSFQNIVFPIPVDDIFYFKDIEPRGCKLYAVNGRLMRVFENQQNGYNVSDLQPGVYVLEFQYNKKVFRYKIIKS